MEMLTALEPSRGLVMIEGNHDLFQGAENFARGVRAYGVTLLRDESLLLTVRGHPVQILGLRWHGRRQAIENHVDTVANLVEPGAFPILLAHHPHAFDRAAERGLPLTLAGHTHGGQIMLTPEFGAGPLMFKYWTGLYERGNSSLVVSNGAGNWFPLRTSAPAEIVHLTLRRA
jgi:predicted MPP superfamily phosphohydrolase